MKKIVLILLFFGATNLFAQQQQDSTLVKEIPTIKNNVFQQRQEIDALTKKLNNQNYTIGKQSKTISVLQEQNSNLKASIDSLGQLIETNSQNIVTNSQELGTKIQKNEQQTESKISELGGDVEKNRLYWIIATLATLLLGGLIYWLLGKRITSSKTDVETQIRNTKASLEEESVKLDNKLVEVLETQLKIQQETTKSQIVSSPENADHSLALKVADEIIRIQKNLSRMDETTKGLKQLNSSVQRIQDNFASNGYELVNMLGKEYNDGMKVSANFVPTEDLETGKQIITRIIKPQVNFKGAMIQAAQIEVSVGE
jgi:septal ring factor EnvC (AmiA/AmiB activator)